MFKLYSTKNKYTNLLISLLIIFILSPLVQYFWWANIVFSVAFFTMVLFSINTISISLQLIFICRIIASVILIMNLIIIRNNSYLSQIGLVISDCCFSLFILIAIVAISHRIIKEKRVNKDVIRGSICIYFMLGLLWFSFYKIVLFFDGNAFRFPVTNIDIFSSQLFYFSFTTLTTVGYGDITPVNGFAMMLSNLEALIGQLFPAIVIAKLVSAYQEENEEREEN